MIEITLPDPLPEGVAVSGGMASFIIPNPDKPERSRIVTAKVVGGKVQLFPDRSDQHRKLAAIYG